MVLNIQTKETKAFRTGLYIATCWVGRKTVRLRDLWLGPVGSEVFPRARLFVIESARGPIIVLAREPTAPEPPRCRVNHARYSPLPHNIKLTCEDFCLILCVLFPTVVFIFIKISTV